MTDDERQFVLVQMLRQRSGLDVQTVSDEELLDAYADTLICQVLELRIAWWELWQVVKNDWMFWPLIVSGIGLAAWWLI